MKYSSAVWIMGVALLCGCFTEPALGAELGASLAPRVREGLNRTIFLDLREINVVDVLKFLAREGDLNIVTSKNVQGRSTLLLHNVTIQDALDIILLSNQLAYDVRHDIIYVMTEDEYTQMFGKNYNDQREVSIRQLSYAKPTYVVTALQSVQSALGKVIIDEETGSVVMVDTPEKIQEMDLLLDQIEHKLETKVIRLQYAKAKDVEAQLQAKLDSKAVGSIFGDERSNQLVVTAYPERMAEIVPLIRSIDREVKAVLIDTKIIQLKLNPKFDYGISWDKEFARDDTNVFDTLGVSGAFPVDSSSSSASTSGSHLWQVDLGDLSDTGFTLKINAIKQVTQSNLLATPRLMVLDGEDAKITIGDRIPYVVTTVTGTGSSTNSSEEVKFIDVGVILTVTPTIHDDGFVTIKIRPEISSKTGEVTTPSDNVIPVVNTTFVESTVVVKNGVTVILGGLRQDELAEDSQGIPFLMDVPILGHIFKSRDEAIQKSEIVIFLTPRIITGGEPIMDEPMPLKPSKDAGWRVL